MRVGKAALEARNVVEKLREAMQPRLVRFPWTAGAATTLLEALAAGFDLKPEG